MWIIGYGNHIPFAWKAAFSYPPADFVEVKKSCSVSQRRIALELRSLLALSSEEFRTFNTRYLEELRSWNILLDNDVNPIARPNVAPVLFPPDEPGIHGFSYVAQSKVTERTFIVAGGGELPDGSTNTADIFRRDDTSPAAMLDKARYVMNRMRIRLRAMDVNWSNVTSINVYNAHDLSEKLVAEVLHA